MNLKPNGERRRARRQAIWMVYMVMILVCGWCWMPTKGLNQGTTSSSSPSSSSSRKVVSPNSSSPSQQGRSLTPSSFWKRWYRTDDGYDQEKPTTRTGSASSLRISRLSPKLLGQMIASSRKRRREEQSIHQRNKNHVQQEEDFLHQPLLLEVPTTTSIASTTTTTGKVSNVHELRQAILDDGMALQDITVDHDAAAATAASRTNRQKGTATTTTKAAAPLVENVLNHEVIELMAKRFHSQSTPGNRAQNDTSKLALAIEGGGMRGAVSAGMASAIACLGLCDTFDEIYGSSAGSVIGVYFVSRQMCMDVYVDILPAAKRTFVCLKRLLKSLAWTSWELFFRSPSTTTTQVTKSNNNNNNNNNNDDNNNNMNQQGQQENYAGMNISFVLDGILDETHGVRPVDFQTLKRNSQKQPLKVAASYAKNGKLYTKCFGTEEFFGDNQIQRQDSKRHGLFAGLEASMTVPGAAGPPVRIVQQQQQQQDKAAVPYFDAFCFEPLPYRSAVQDGATHVLVLCSRPEGFQAKTKPGFYETTVAPLFFHFHDEPEVAQFFKRGGQQYIYLEDLMTLEEAKHQPSVSVPPPEVLYGVSRDDKIEGLSSNRQDWRTASLLPLKVPLGTPELPTLEQGKDQVREAVRGGFAAAFDMLAPAIGVSIGVGKDETPLTGMQVAELFFPEDYPDERTRNDNNNNNNNSNHNNNDDEHVLTEQVRVLGDIISDQPRKERVTPTCHSTSLDHHHHHTTHHHHHHHAKTLLETLPGIQSGRMSQLTRGLKSHL